MPGVFREQILVYFLGFQLPTRCELSHGLRNTTTAPSTPENALPADSSACITALHVARTSQWQAILLRSRTARACEQFLGACRVADSARKSLQRDPFGVFSRSLESHPLAAARPSNSCRCVVVYTRSRPRRGSLPEPRAKGVHSLSRGPSRPSIRLHQVQQPDIQHPSFCIPSTNSIHHSSSTTWLK